MHLTKLTAFDGTPCYVDLTEVVLVEHLQDMKVLGETTPARTKIALAGRSDSVIVMENSEAVATLIAEKNAVGHGVAPKHNYREVETVEKDVAPERDHLDDLSVVWSTPKFPR